MTVSNNTIEAVSLGYFFEKMRKSSAQAATKLATNVVKNSGRAELGAQKVEQQLLEILKQL